MSFMDNFEDRLTNTEFVVCTLFMIIAITQIYMFVENISLVTVLCDANIPLDETKCEETLSPVKLIMSNLFTSLALSVFFLLIVIGFIIVFWVFLFVLVIFYLWLLTLRDKLYQLIFKEKKNIKKRKKYEKLKRCDYG